MGKLLRTLYFCDHLSNPVFRVEILDLLNQGEAVHSLQRAIHNGMITAKHGRTIEQLGAISGALTLLANIVMAWNTRHIQAVIDRRFFRRKYDAARALALFSLAIREDASGDLSQLCEDLIQVVADTLEPDSLSLWLRPAETKE